MNKWMIQLVTAAMLIVLGAPAWAGHVYIDPASCGPNPNAVTAGWSDATRIDNVGTWHDYVTYSFGNLTNPNMVCHFTMPGDATTGQFTAQVDLRGSADNTGTYFVFAMAGVANVRTQDYDQVSPEAAGGNSIITTQPGPTAGLTFVSTIAPVIITDALTGNPCGTEGIACLNRRVTLWVWRLTSEDVCSDTNRPFACCNGLGAGSCIVGSPYAGTVQLMQIDLSY